MLLFAIIILLILIVFSLNIISIIKIKWNNSFFKKKENECLIINKNKIYEYDSYRYNLYNYIFDIDNKNKFENSTYTYKTTYQGIIILLILVISLLIYSLYYNYATKNLILLVSISIYVLCYYYVGKLILKDYDKIKSLKNDNTDNLIKYMNVYKILNTLMYLNSQDNVMYEVFEYNTRNIKNSKTLDKLLEENIAKIHYTSNEIEIEYIKSKAIGKKDYLKYISLDSISPFYFGEYFENQYIIISNKKYYIKDLLDNSTAINQEIGKNLNTTIIIPDNNYIKYYHKNKSLLFNINTNFKTEFENIINRNIYIILIFILYFIFLVIFCHILYSSINNILYLFVIGIIIVLLYLFLMII
tara:strand:- start:785 stop:1858 length:1074 start_codon:yes stop_codon:yes gene_type:complete